MERDKSKIFSGKPEQVATAEKKKRGPRKGKAETCLAKIQEVFSGKVSETDLQGAIGKIKPILDDLQEKFESFKKSPLKRLVTGKTKEEIASLIEEMKKQLAKM